MQIKKLQKIYGGAVKEIFRDKIGILFGFIFFSLSIKLFLLFSHLSQISQVWKYRINLWDFYLNALLVYKDTFLVLEFWTFFLYFIWVVLFFIFSLTLFVVMRQKAKLIMENLKVEENIKANKTHKKYTIISSLSFLFSFLGFGCVACGQTLLYSITLLLFSGTSINLHILSNITIFIGIVFLIFVIHKNIKSIYFKDICEV